MRLYYRVTTLDPIIVSQNSATTNNHECLDYIPGSAMLGAMAAQHYATLSAEQSWRAFHSGDCRFSPCYPVTAGQLSMPTPASWHYPKGESDINPDTGTYNPDLLTNHAATSFERDTTLQYKQCRDGYLLADGTSPNVKKGLSTKTAIDSTTGKAKDSQLFSYAYLDAGQTFAGWIDCDDATLLETFKTSLNQTLRIGRSRNTEFGRVALTLQSVDDLPCPKNLKNRLVLWCLSDCELLDEQGLPTLKPSAQSIHPRLTGKLDRAHSFIRGTRISRFNQKRQGLDTEQLLISKGSVIVLTLDNAPSTALLQTLSTQGIGLNRQQGLGWVNVNPPWAEKGPLSHDALFDPINIEPPESPKVSDVKSPLTRWLDERVKHVEADQQVQEKVNALLKEIVLSYKNARCYNNILMRNEAGPSSTQWRRIANEVRTNNDDWKDRVFKDKNAICKANNDELGWGIQWHNGKALTHFAEFSQDKLSEQPLSVMRLLLEQLCRYDLSTFQGLKKPPKELKPDVGDQ